MSEMARGVLICRTKGQPEDNWYHLFPRGEFEIVATIRGRETEITLVLDSEAFQKMVAAAAADARADNWEGYLVGQEHFAQMASGSSEAHAWCMELEERADGLWGRFEKTALGEASIGKTYKYRSPVAELEQISGRKWRPVHLIDIGLTNKPMFKTLASAKGRDCRNTEEEEMLERMRAILGLGSDATEDQVAARVKEALGKEQKLAATESELSKLKDEVLAREADAFVEEHKDQIEDSDEARRTVKEQYIAARETTVALFGAGKKAAGSEKSAQRVLAREQARTPAGKPGDEPQAGESARAARVRARATEISDREHIGFSQAWNRAEAEIPRD